MPMRRRKMATSCVAIYSVLALVGPGVSGFRITSSCTRSSQGAHVRAPYWGGGNSRGRWRSGGGRLQMARDFYEVLDIPETADQSEIKRAYRRKALKTHPDVNTSPTAKADFSAVVEAYEVLSDEKKRANYNMKRKFTNPFHRGAAGAGGAAGSRAGSRGGDAGAAWASATYNAAREEAARRWREQNPTPDQIDDSFSDIFRDLFGGIASSAVGGRGVLNDVVDFLESQVDGFSSDTSVEFEDLMASRNLEEMKAELENTRLLLEQLRIKSRKLSVDKVTAEKEVVAIKARSDSRRFTDIDELDRQMAAVERAAGIKARYDELQGHVKRANARLGRLERKVADLESGVGGRRATGSRYGSGSASRSGYSPSASSSSTYSSSRGSSSSAGGPQRSTSDGGGGSRSSGSSSGSTSGSASTKAPPPPPPPRYRAPGGRRRPDDPEVEAELARMKREMGMK